MRILIVKTSSLGDVIHNLPVVSDIRRHFPDATVDWCVEENFSDIPRFHPAVNKIISVAIRRWRKVLFKESTWREIGAFRSNLRAAHYDFVIDTQGLLKSALLARQARGPVCGYDADSAREPIAAQLYNRRFRVSTTAHAVVRNRQLTSSVLGYVADGVPDYGIEVAPAVFDWLPDQPYIVFLTATSRDDKLWPETHWVELGRALHGLGLRAIFPAGNPVERARAARLADAIPEALAAPSMNIPQLAALLAGSRAAVGVDTGLSHLAVALDVPTVALYTATDPGLTGVFGAGFHRNLGGKAQIPSVQSVLTELGVALA